MSRVAILNKPVPFAGIFNISSDDVDLSVDTWYHVAFVRDGDTARFFLDGVAKGTGSLTVDVPAMAGSMFIGSSNDWGGVGANMRGYMDEVRISNNARYTSAFTPSTSAFTEDQDTLLLIHSDTSDASTTFTDSSGVLTGLGYDNSANSNNWTVNNLTADDQVLDSPTNNFATLQLAGTPAASGVAFSEGNLKFGTGTTGSGRNCNRLAISTIAQSSGKWYAEVEVLTVGSFIGITTPQDLVSPTANNTRYAYYFAASATGEIYMRTAGSETSPDYGSASVVGDVVQIAVDMDESTPEVFFGKNGLWGNGSDAFDQATPTNAIVLGDTFFNTDTGGGANFVFSLVSSGGATDSINIINFGQDSSFAGTKTAQGNQDGNDIGDFYYTPPTGFLALCTSNLPATITPSEHFNTILYDDGAGAKTGVGFQPDLVWLKSKGNDYHHKLVDAVRGVTKSLSSSISLASFLRLSKVKPPLWIMWIICLLSDLLSTLARACAMSYVS